MKTQTQMEILNPNISSKFSLFVIQTLLHSRPFSGYRGKHVLKAAGKNGGGSKRPPKRKAETADDEGDEEEGENAKEGGK